MPATRGAFLLSYLLGVCLWREQVEQLACQMELLGLPPLLLPCPPPRCCHVVGNRLGGGHMGELCFMQSPPRVCLRAVSLEERHHPGRQLYHRLQEQLHLKLH